LGHRAIHTDNAPGALGPYSQAIDVDLGTGRLVFLSGQIPIDPGTGDVIGGSVTDQVHRVMANLAAVLEAAGSGFDRVVKTTIFLTDMGDFAEVNAAYGDYFGDVPPARATVEVRRLPKDVRVEIEAVATA
jgi:2-iminobutanoate/2-iminopropanoate deaminase